MASEHGDGIARGEWLEQTYGAELIMAMRSLKRAADPHGLLNPGKMFDAPPMDQHLRYGADYRARAWSPGLDFSRNGGLTTAIEQCNGQGVCRKDTGVMCPSFQATREEMHSTRGRANLLRSLIMLGTIEGRAGFRHPDVEQAAFDALDLCLACKGCKAECPSGVDMAKLKFEFLGKYYDEHPRRLRDYLFGYFHITARLLSSVAPMINYAAAIPKMHRFMARLLNITADRPFPKFAGRLARSRRQPGGTPVIFLRDSFTHYVESHVEQAAFDLLHGAGFDVILVSAMAASAALMSKGFLRGARSHAAGLLSELQGVNPEGGMPIVGLEPSEVYAFKHEVVDLLPERRDEIVQRASNTWLLEEFLVRSGLFSSLRIATTGQQVLFHPHCHQKAEAAANDGLPGGSDATTALLRACGYEVKLIDAGCCGMAGTFGYEGEHYALSQSIGSLRLFPQLRECIGVPVAATGAACRMQIAQGTGADVQHPVMLAERALRRK